MAEGRPNPISTFRAKRAFKAFTGHEPTKETVARLDSKNTAAYRLGTMVGVAYEATRDGETGQYFHRFKKKARPELAARADGKQLYITGGDYHVTDRGIEDMPHLFVVNPSRRRRSKAGRSKGGQFLSNPRRRKRRAAPKARRTRRAASVFMANPAPRRRRRRAPRVMSVRRYRRNPSGLTRGKGTFNIAAMIMPAGMIGLGIVGTEAIMSKMTFLPPALLNGPTRYATKAMVGVIAGYFLAKFVNRKAGESLALGAIAIGTHDAVKSALTTYVPGLALGGYNWDPYGYGRGGALATMRSPGIGYYTPGATLRTMGQYMRPGMGEYMTPRHMSGGPDNQFPESG